MGGYRHLPPPSRAACSGRPSRSPPRSHTDAPSKVGRGLGKAPVRQDPITRGPNLLASLLPGPAAWCCRPHVARFMSTPSSHLACVPSWCGRCARGRLSLGTVSASHCCKQPLPSFPSQFPKVDCGEEITNSASLPGSMFVSVAPVWCSVCLGDSTKPGTRVVAEQVKLPPVTLESREAAV